jgi:hypothetical protein
LKRILIGVAVALSLFTISADTPASAHLTTDHRYLLDPSYSRGSMIKLTSKLTCPVGSYNSIADAANSWNGYVFTPNGGNPLYLWNSSCNQTFAGTAPINWFDASWLPCDEYPEDCFFGFAESLGYWDDPPGGGGNYGVCGEGAFFCTHSNRADITISSNPAAQMTATNYFTQRILRHELGHPVGLADVTTACITNSRSIMYYDCVLHYSQAAPGPHDRYDIDYLYY